MIAAAVLLALANGAHAVTATGVCPLPSLAFNVTLPKVALHKTNFSAAVSLSPGALGVLSSPTGSIHYSVHKGSALLKKGTWNPRTPDAWGGVTLDFSIDGLVLEDDGRNVM